MNTPLENLCGTGKALTVEAPDSVEFSGLINSGHKRLYDAVHAQLSL